jgi:hypothetical protein
MGLIATEMAMGTHAWFVREGDAFAAGVDVNGNVLGAGVVSVNAKPAANDAAWILIDTIESWEDSIKDEDKPIYTPAPGHLVRKRIITTKEDLDMKFTCGQVSALAMELFYRSATKLNSASSQFNPMSYVPRQGFLKLQRYSDTDVLILSADLWVRMKISAGMKGGDGNITTPEFEAALLYSAMNTMALG